MSLFHRHQWTEVARRFVPPIDGEAEVEGYGVASGAKGLMYDIANGYTVIELRCSECGDVTSRHIQGDAT